MSEYSTQIILMLIGLKNYHIGLIFGSWIPGQWLKEQYYPLKNCITSD